MGFNGNAPVKYRFRLPQINVAAKVCTSNIFEDSPRGSTRLMVMNIINEGHSVRSHANKELLPAI